MTQEYRVGKVKDVYGRGKNVISWLGDEPDDGHRACQQRRTLATARDATAAQELRVRWEEIPAQFHDGCLLEMHEAVDSTRTCHEKQGSHCSLWRWTDGLANFHRWHETGYFPQIPSDLIPLAQELRVFIVGENNLIRSGRK